MIVDIEVVKLEIKQMSESKHIFILLEKKTGCQKKKLYSEFAKKLDNYELEKEKFTSFFYCRCVYK